MATPLHKKASNDEIRRRFDADVERFSSLDTGQAATIDAPLAMDLITQAAVAATPRIERVLDLGCGAGNNTLKLIQAYPGTFDCDLLDLSRPMLERARKRIRSENACEIRTLHCDLRDAPLPDRHYDVVIAAAVLHHLRDDPDWESAFRTLYRILRPGGSVWITDLVIHDSPRIHELMWHRYASYLESQGGPEYRDHVLDYIDREDSPRSLPHQLDLLKAAGFDTVEVLHKNVCFAAFGAIKAS
jgi:tRNA (cmo5U34)-methyltransferase